MEKPETTEQVDVSGEATELQMATLDSIESAITHDAIQGETIDEHHASEIEYLRNLLVRAEAGGLDSNPPPTAYGCVASRSNSGISWKISKEVFPISST